MHKEKHKYAGKTFFLKSKNPKYNGEKFKLEDWQINVCNGIEWGEMDGNPAAMIYGMHAGFNGLPDDDRVLCGKIGMMGYMVHESELGDIVEEQEQR